MTQAHENKSDIIKLPVRLVIESTWILDTNVAEKLNKSNFKMKSS
jgi:hypothetical protein